ncbi:MAG: hypothetical protein ACYTGH_04570 [Planctomycetota bacterium]|jgi:hypothetical protein
MATITHDHHERHSKLFGHEPAGFIVGRIVMVGLLALAMWLLLNWAAH